MEAIEHFLHQHWRQSGPLTACKLRSLAIALVLGDCARCIQNLWLLSGKLPVRVGTGLVCHLELPLPRGRSPALPLVAPAVRGGGGTTWKPWSWSGTGWRRWWRRSAGRSRCGWTPGWSWSLCKRHSEGAA